MATPAPDRIVADRYALKAPLGRGGMGVVWHAHDTVLGRAVAVKEVVLPPTMPDEERRAAHARVLREARAAARLNHPGAVILYDVVQDQGHPFIVMELVPASTLADLVRTSGPLPPEQVAEIGGQLAATLEAAHRVGIVHRDVKPGNVMVAEDGGVKLADFGVASLQGDPQLTATGLVLGSPAYMAPEQAAGELSGPPADFWALGATMFFAAEGTPPFDKGASIATLAAVVNEDPQPMRRAGALAPVLGALLAKDPAARPSGPRVRAELERLAAAAATSATQELPAHPNEPPPASTTAQLPAVPPATAPTTPPAASPATPPVTPAAAPPATPPAAASAAPEPAAEPTAPPAVEHAPADPAAEPTGPPPAEPAAAPAGPPVAGTAVGSEPVAAGPGFGVRLPPAGERPGFGAAGGARPVPPVATPGRPGGRLLGYLALVALVALAGMLIAWAASTLSSDGGGAATDTTRGGATETTRAPATPGAAGQLPAGWTSFTNRRGNDVVGVPPGWRARARQSNNAAVVEEPDGARRVFTVRSTNPANPLPQASRDYRAHAERTFQGYREIRFDEGATYAGRSGAVVFEYEADRDGRRVHVSHINFRGRTWGYNVEFVTPAGQWDSSQELARQFEQAFRPLG
jgi:eukaryotic-like serine/threonine-protein kinase